ncbi:MAG: hypothetical protein ACSHYA_17665 [Opitutaceae bacterium]
MLQLPEWIESKLELTMSRLRLAALSYTLAACGTAFGGVLEIGDLSKLENWSGLTAANEKAELGDASAKLQSSGKAEFVYTEPKEYVGYLTPPFSDMHDEIAVEDWFNYNYIEFSVKLPDDRFIDLEVTISPMKIGRPDYVESVFSKVRIQGNGWQKIVLPLREFEYTHHQGTFWRFIKSVSISAEFEDKIATSEVFISQPRIKQSKAVSLNALVKSKPANPGNTATYQLVVENETGATQHVELLIEETGYEACTASLSQKRLKLAPWERTQVELSVAMNDLVAPGGRETTRISVIPNGRGDLKEELKFQTVRYLEHPYLMHTEAGWQGVIEKAATVEWAGVARDEYLAAAEAWKVPNLGKGSFCYRTKESRKLLNAAIAWKLSGNEAFAEKAMKFLRDLSNPGTGYPTKLRATNGTHVHQGMFFVDVARSYDLLYNHETFSDEDHTNMERTFRAFSNWVNPALETGDGNNHQVSLSAATIINGLVMQDFDEVDRYLYGTGGYVDLLGQGILDDGQYFEGTANYNILTGNIANSVVVAFEPWGMDVKNWKIPAKYGKFIMTSDWAMRGDFLGMNFERQGPSTRNYRQLKDIWDAVLPMSDYRGVVFPTADSVAIDLAKAKSEAGFGYDLSYHLWRDPAYVPLLKIMEKRDLLYGVADLPEIPFNLGKGSYLSENVGFAVLRSQSEGKEDRERIQAVQRYGTHGGYHGHFDRTSLASLSRYGRTPYGPEASWYGYWSFMFKMWVQTSSSHNMVVVDHRMQKPSECRTILFHSGDLMQVSATEIETEWIDPPYGGQTPYALTMPEEKTWGEARWLPTPENPRPQGDTGTPSKPVLQRRLIVVTDDYVVMADYLRGEDTHEFDNLFNCKGLTNFEADELTHLKHTAQCDPDPYSSAQFITDCNWYASTGSIKSSFLLDWSKGDMGGRMSQSEPGKMNVDYYSLWPKDADVMVGNYPETLNVARHLYYKAIGDGKVIAEGKLAPWILGKADLDIDVEGISELTIETRIDKAKASKTIFLGNPRLVESNGTNRPIAATQTENIAPSAGENLDYAGGKVTLFGEHYATSIAAEPANRKEVGTLTFDLSDQNAQRFKATLGGDYPVGGDDIHRKIIATRSTGTEARFVSAIELHEDNPQITSINTVDAETIEIKLADGRSDTLKIDRLDGDGTDIQVTMTRFQDGQPALSEKSL